MLSSMRMTVWAAIVCALVAGTVTAASAGPVKHWAALPDRDIRTVPFHDGALSLESRLDVVPGRDGWIYVRGKNAVYRMLGTGGAAAEVASFAWCDDRQARAVVSYRVPGFACVAKNMVVEVAGGSQYRRALPQPGWSDARDVYQYDYPFVTSIDRTDAGRWWFAYGYARGIGYSDPDGSTRMVRLGGLPPIRDVARLGGDVYVAADGCVLARVRDFAVRSSQRLCASPIAPMLVRTGDALWVLTGSTAERRDAVGRAQRWNLNVAVGDVAYDRRSRTTYLLGNQLGTRTVLISIGRDGVPHAVRLPMTGGASIAVDARSRIWISVPAWHALVAIAPEGAWG